MNLTLDWKSLLTTLAPVILAVIPGLAPLTPFVVLGIGEAEKMAGASGPEKLAHATEIAKAGIAGTNAIAVEKTGKPLMDPTLADSALQSGISAVVDVVNLVQAAKAANPPPAVAA